MKRVLLLLFIFQGVWRAGAQERKLFKFNPGERIATMIPASEMYTYPSFTTGYVFFKDERTGSARMNYNMLISEMQFIDPNGDTLSLAEQELVRSIAIGRDTFYFDDGFIRKTAAIGSVNLGERVSFAMANRQKLGGYGEMSNGSIDTYTKLSAPAYFKDLVASEVLTLAKVTTLFIGDRFGKFRELTKKNLQGLYSRHRTELNSYLEEKKPDLRNADDVRNLLTYMSTLN